MEKELIPIEQAIILQELGFNEPCFKFHTIKKECSICVENVCPLHNIHCAYPACVTAGIVPLPVWSQAFRWFKDVHKLEANIRSDMFGYATYITDRAALKSFATKPKNILQHYEEAELACLDWMIKMLKERQ